MEKKGEQRMRISLVQMDIALGDPKINRQRAEEWIRRAAEREQADVVVLPEMWNTGYALDRLEDCADRGELVEWMASTAARYRVHLVGGSIAEKKADHFWNTAYIFDRNGKQVARYSKVHLFRLMDEEKYLHAGDQRVSFSLESHRAGVMICYDIRFPELARSLALDGAEILFVPAEWPLPRLTHWRLLNQARAVENQLYVVACNRVGVGGRDVFGGHSMVVDPWGEILVEGGEEEELLTVEIDLAEVARIRRKIPVFEDRMPDVYRSLGRDRDGNKES
jgi:omega-amidase